MKEVAQKLNVVYVISDHLFDGKHSTRHRMAVGAIVMVFGVVVSKSGFGFAHAVAHYAADIIGYAIHGLGAVPFIERLGEMVRGEAHEEEPPLPVIDSQFEEG